MILSVLRAAFIFLVATVAALYLLTQQEGVQIDFIAFVLAMAVALALASAVIALDVWTKHKRLSAVSGVFLGLIAGLLAAYALSFVVDFFGILTAPEEPEAREAYFNLLEGVKILIGLITCYIGISLVLQTKDDFRFVIPYVEFAKEVRGNRPTILDTSVIVDGRILDITATGIMQGTLIVPKFVLNELQTIADSADKLRRARGRRGLEVLAKLQENHAVEVAIHEAEHVEGAGVDQKLIALAQQSQGRIMTNDYNLNKVARLRGVDVINLNDLAKALRPVVLPGEHMSVRLVKPGENANQGVGYLEDGTMVVVEDGRDHLDQVVQLVVTSTLQTSAGRMIFGRYEQLGGDAGHGPAAPGDAGREHQPVAAAIGGEGAGERVGDTGHGAATEPDDPAMRPRRAGRNPRRSR